MLFYGYFFFFTISQPKIVLKLDIYSKAMEHRKEK